MTLVIDGLETNCPRGEKRDCETIIEPEFEFSTIRINFTTESFNPEEEGEKEEVLIEVIRVKFRHPLVWKTPTANHRRQLPYYTSQSRFSFSMDTFARGTVPRGNIV